MILVVFQLSVRTFLNMPPIFICSLGYRILDMLKYTFSEFYFCIDLITVQPTLLYMQSHDSGCGLLCTLIPMGLIKPRGIIIIVVTTTTILYNKQNQPILLLSINLIFSWGIYRKMDIFICTYSIWNLYQYLRASSVCRVIILDTNIIIRTKSLRKCSKDNLLHKLEIIYKLLF